MNLNHSIKISFVAIILFIALVTVISYAEPPIKIPETFENYLQSLNDRIKKLEDTQKQSKDNWDKFASVSTFLSGVIIALIGIYATSVYNQRQLKSQRIQKNREISVLRTQTVEKFFGHLTSENQSIRRAALDSIIAIGDEKLAAKLASHSGGESGAAVLASLSKSSNPDVVQIASKGLTEHFSYLQQSIIVIGSHAGFFVSSEGLILVPSSALSKEQIGMRIPFTIKMDIPSTGTSLSAEVLERYNRADLRLTLMKIKLNDPVAPIDDFSDTIGIGHQVVALGFSRHLGWINAVGRITNYFYGPTVINKINCDIETEPVMAGAPVINIKGKLIGIPTSACTPGSGLKKDK